MNPSTPFLYCRTDSCPDYTDPGESSSVVRASVARTGFICLSARMPRITVAPVALCPYMPLYAPYYTPLSCPICPIARIF
jgi:hypothetical protein